MLLFYIQGPPILALLIPTKPIACYEFLCGPHGLQNRRSTKSPPNVLVTLPGWPDLPALLKKANASAKILEAIFRHKNVGFGVKR